MTAYVDDAAKPWKGKPRFHMTADSLEELHAFAFAIQVHRCWFHRGARHPHYDITEAQRAEALTHGARAVSQRELVSLARKIAPASTQAA